MSDQEEIDYDSKFDIDIEDIGDEVEEPGCDTTPVFPTEISNILNERTKILVRQNDELKLNLSQATDEIQRLQLKSSQLSEQLNRRSSEQSLGSELASTKLIELSKKNRNLNAELEATKMRCAALQTKLEEALATPSEPSDAEDEPTKQAKENAIVEELQAEVTTLREQLSASKQRTFEARNQNQSLRTELKQMQRLLQQEIGDGAPTIHSSGSLGSNWRGRAQQIIALQNKVAELQQRAGHSVVPDQVSQLALRQMESQRRLSQENTAKELAVVRAQLESKDNKLNAIRARCRALEIDNEARKKRVQTLLEKTVNDNQFIKALHVTQNQAMKKHALEIREKTIQQEKLKEKISDLELQVSKWRIRFEEQQRHVKEKEAYIETLKESRDSDNDLEHNYKKEYYRTLCRASEAEKLKLGQLLRSTHERLDAEILKNVQQHRLFLTERNKGAQLRTRLDLLEKEYKQLRKRQTVKAPAIGAGIGAGGTAPAAACPAATESPNEALALQFEELRNKLQLAEESRIAMEERLETILQERNEDIARINEMIQQTRETFRKAAEKL